MADSEVPAPTLLIDVRRVASLLGCSPGTSIAYLTPGACLRRIASVLWFAGRAPMSNRGSPQAASRCAPMEVCDD